MFSLDDLFAGLNWTIFWAVVAVFVVIQVLLIWSVVKMRQRRGSTDQPAQTRRQTALNLFWTLIPALVVIPIFLFALLLMLDTDAPNGNSGPFDTDLTTNLQELPHPHRWRGFPLSRWERGPGGEGNIATPTSDWYDGLTTATSASASALSPPELAATPAEPAIQVLVTGRRWFWELDYADEGFFTADELYIPVGSIVLLEITSNQVPLTLWLPQQEPAALEVLPDATGYLWLFASEPGSYEGLCAENCDDPTAYMPLRIVAVEPAAFAAWVEQQQGPAPEPTTPLTQEGEVLMSSKACLGCHALYEISEEPRVGPNLTGMALRSRIAGVVPYSEETMRRWLANPVALKPGTTMPRLNLSEAEIAALAAYMDILE